MPWGPEVGFCPHLCFGPRGDLASTRAFSFRICTGVSRLRSARLKGAEFAQAQHKTRGAGRGAGCAWMLPPAF